VLLYTLSLSPVTASSTCLSEPHTLYEGLPFKLIRFYNYCKGPFPISKRLLKC
jgi:hypothetical protein